MLKRVIFISLMIFLISWNITSQITIKGRIENSNTGKGVEYATIHKEGTNVGAICDSVGYFELNNLEFIPDSLTISCVGYKSKKIYKEEISTTVNVVVKLNEKKLLLDELTVARDKLTKKTMNLGKRDRVKSRYIPIYFASQQVRLFKALSFPSYLEEFSFYVGFVRGNKSARIRIYDVDSLTHMPGCDLLNSNLIVKNLKKGWNKVDLNQYRISIPEHGFYIGIESVTIDEDSWVKNAENIWVTKYNDFQLGCAKENSIKAIKILHIGGFEKYGEEPINPESNKWHKFQGGDFNLPYQVKVGYYE